jgi:hypothetical protein
VCTYPQLTSPQAAKEAEELRLLAYPEELRYPKEERDSWTMPRHDVVAIYALEEISVRGSDIKGGAQFMKVW